MPKISSLFNSVTELLPSRASLGVHGPSAIIHTCKIALFALLLGQGCRFSKASLRSGDAIYPDRCRVRIPETHPAFQVDLSTPMDVSPVVADRALAVTDTAKVQLREAFVYYNPTSGKYAAGKMDTTSLEHAVACLGVKPEGFLTCDDAQQLLDKFGPEDVQNLQNTPPFGENVYRSFSTPRGAPSSGKIVWSEMSWISPPGPDDPLPEEMDVLQSYLKIPDTLYEEPLTLTVQRGIDIKDSTQSATYVSLVDMNPSTSDSVSLSPLNRIILATVPLDASASQASSTAEAMKWGLIPPHISIEPSDTSQAERDRAYRVAYDEAGYYRESNQSRWLADLGRQIDATRRSYDIYDATCPGSLNSWRMFGFGSADDMMYNALQARTDLENATWTDLPDTSVSDSTSTTPENCSSVQRTSNESFQINSTCDDLVFSVMIFDVSGTLVRSDMSVSAGEEVNFGSGLTGKSAGTYRVYITGPNFSYTFSVVH